MSWRLTSPSPLTRWILISSWRRSLHSFLFNRTQKVMVNGKLSEPSPVLSGVPQGSVLGPLLFLLLIGDIDNGLGISLLSSFADDTRILAAVSNVLQASNLQKDLEVVYEWARANKMEFNSSKFELLRYWLKDEALRYCTNYTSPSGSIIPEKEHVKDLGVMLSQDGSFNEHVRNVIKKVKNLTSWILRSFSIRSAEVMLTLWKSIVLPHIEYASQLWSPIRKGPIQQLEDLQWCFLRKIKSCVRGNYWATLKKFRLYSLERRRERYRVIYLWKMIEGLVPNLDSNGAIEQTINERQGRKCRLKNNVMNSLPRIRTLRDGSFSANAVKLFNSIPKEIRNATNCNVDSFKSQLDDFLKSVPDEPQIPGMTRYRRADSNSIVDMMLVV